MGARPLRAAWLLLGIAVLESVAWGFWLFYGTDQRAQTQARSAVERFEASCASDGQGQPQSASTSSEVIGLLSFPQFSDESWPVLAGVSNQDLGTGIGWYPETAGVGEIGNMALVGYRITHGAPFADLLELNEGDQVEIVTCADVYVYQIDIAPRDLTVTPSDDWVMDAVPGDAGKRPNGRMITLITSQDLLPSSDRSVGMGHLVSSRPR